MSACGKSSLHVILTSKDYPKRLIGRECLVLRDKTLFWKLQAGMIPTKEDD